jgi:ribosomal protein S18 acetylase RimI-like enzyme
MDGIQSPNWRALPQARRRGVNRRTHSLTVVPQWSRLADGFSKRENGSRLIATYRRVVTYRQADKSDIPAMARMGSEGEEGRVSADRMARYLGGTHHPQDALMPRIIYVAVENDSVVGYVAGHLTRRYECDGELQWIYVAAEHRRRRVGSELVRLLASWFATQNASRICVNVAPDNAGAQNFYARQGAQNLNRQWMVWSEINAVVPEP